jgi:hypothetical protein
LRAHGDLERAKTLLEESLISLRRTAYTLRVANVRANTLARPGSIECESGRNAPASELYKQSLGLEQRFGFTHHVLVPLEGMSHVAAVRGRPEQAAQLLGATAALRDEMGMPLTYIARADHERATDAAREMLGADAFTAAWSRGHAMCLEGALSTTLDGA